MNSDLCVRARRLSHHRLITRSRTPSVSSLSLGRYTLARAFHFGYGRFTLAHACHFCLSLPPMFAQEAGARPRWSDTAAHAPSLRDRACVDIPASTHCLTRADSEKCVHFPLPVYITENSCTNTLGRHKQYTMIWNSTNFRQFVNSILTSELLLLYIFTLLSITFDLRSLLFF